jgi:prepilin-type N-terminal cleavage/methylation domain-containing protein
MKKQAGFTLVEIAIVLVIIGLLLGGVLKGQELINSAKVKNFANDFKQVPLFIYGYQDKYKALPGDDRNTNHVGPAATAAGVADITLTTGTANGQIDGGYNSTSTTDETVVFWQQVRLANLAAGSTNFTTPANVLPTNADGGRIGVQSAPPITGMSGSYFVCSDGIQGKFAKQIDQTLDDGDTAAGSVRVAANPTATWSTAVAAVPLTGTGAIVDSTTYMVCMGF